MYRDLALFYPDPRLLRMQRARNQSRAGCWRERTDRASRRDPEQAQRVEGDLAVHVDPKSARNFKLVSDDRNRPAIRTRTTVAYRIGNHRCVCLESSPRPRQGVSSLDGSSPHWRVDCTDGRTAVEFRETAVAAD